MSAISANLTSPPDNFSTTLSSGISSSDLSIPLNSVSGLPTEGVGVLFTKDANGDVVAGSVEIIHWTGIGGSSLTLTNTGDRGLTGSDSGAQAFSAGAYFEIWVTSYYYKSLRDGIAAIDVAALIHAAANKATPVDADEFGIYDSVAAILKNVTWANIKTTLLAWLRLSTTIIPVNAPQGFLINGKISVTDASGITVALKTLAGNDPSSSDPVYVRIGDTVRTITSALSKSNADGTNYMNAGSSELATKEIDYFVHIGWNASNNTPFIGWARIPCSSIANIASYNTIDEKSLMCSQTSADGLVNADYMEVVGRFAATLSAGAGYTWSVPAYTALNLIQHPIYESRWLDYVPQTTASAGTWGNQVGRSGNYQVRGDTIFYSGYNSGTTSSTPQNLRLSLPFTPTASYTFWAIPGYTTDAGTAMASSQEVATGSALVYIYKYNFANYAATTAQVGRSTGFFKI